MSVHGWWWHLFHDPMRDNPWSVAALLVIIVVAGLVPRRAAPLTGGGLRTV